MNYQPGEELDSLMKFALELVQGIWDARQALGESYSNDQIDPLEVMRGVVDSVEDLDAIASAARVHLAWKDHR